MPKVGCWCLLCRPMLNRAALQQGRKKRPESQFICLSGFSTISAFLTNKLGYVNITPKYWEISFEVVRACAAYIKYLSSNFVWSPQSCFYFHLLFLLIQLHKSVKGLFFTSLLLGKGYRIWENDYTVFHVQMFHILNKKWNCQNTERNFACWWLCVSKRALL